MAGTNDIFLAYISWGTGGKVWPILVMDTRHDSLLVYYITSQYEVKSEQIRRRYYPIQQWKEAGLDKQSYIATNSIHMISKRTTYRKIGELQLVDIEGMTSFLDIQALQTIQTLQIQKRD